MGKIAKRLAAIGASIVIASMASIPALAAYQCDTCGVGTVTANYSYSSWVVDGSTPCSKVSGAKDVVMVRVVTSDEKCSYCGVTYHNSWAEHKTVCNH